jgi:hypothetical protein
MRRRRRVLFWFSKKIKAGHIYCHAFLKHRSPWRSFRMPMLPRPISSLLLPFFLFYRLEHNFNDGCNVAPALSDHHLLEKIFTFFGFRFSCEQTRQPAFEFDIASEVLFIYRLIPRKFDFLRWLAALGTTPVNRFSGGFS